VELEGFLGLSSSTFLDPDSKDTVEKPEKYLAPPRIEHAI
jgi:hypothetical protein